MYNKFKVIVVMVFLFFGTITGAQSQLGLEDIIPLVLNENFELKLAESSLAIQRKSSTKSEAGLYPTLTASYSFVNDDGQTSYKYETSSANILRVDSSDSATSDTSYGSLTLTETLTNVMLPFYNYKRLQKQLNISEIEFKSLTDQLLLDTIATYYNILRLNTNINLLEETVDNASDHVSDIKSQYDLGAATLLELLTAKEAVNQHKIQLYGEQLELKKQEFHLNTLCGLEPEHELMVKETIQLDKNLKLSLLKQQVLEKNISIEIASKKEELSDIDIKMIKADVFPSLSFSLGLYNSLSHSNSGFLRESNKTGTEFQIAASWTIYNGGQRINALKNIKNQKKLIELQSLNTKALVLEELYNLFEQYQTGLNVLSLLSESIKTQQTHYNQSQFLFKTGQLSITELQASKIQVLTAKKQYNDQLLNCRVVELRLYQLSGQLNTFFST